MNEQQPRTEQPGLTPTWAGHPASTPPLLTNRKTQAFWGGMVAGLAIATALALVMHVIQQASPNGGYSILGSVMIVLLLGVIIGSGLGIGLAAAVPDSSPEAATPHPAPPADQPPVPSA